MRFRAAGLIVALGLVSLIGPDASAIGAASVTFQDTAWPFLIDQWGTGRALRCEGPQCGDTKLYVRSKVGFCECFNHVDADDVDRLTDFDLLGGEHVVPLGPGRPLAVAGHSARLNAFRLESAKRPPRQAVSVVVESDCQAVVAMLVSARAPSPAVEAAVLDLMTGAISSDSGIASTE
jgi:hypothetical protein